MSVSRRWVVIAAAGRSERFAGDLPKQYAMLVGRPVLERTLHCFDGLPGLQGIVTAVAASDTRFESLHGPDTPIHMVTGGSTRSRSVLAALDWLLDGPGNDHDWVMVHDAARPLLPHKDRDALADACERDGMGGLLATEVVDTLKRGESDGRVSATVEREGIWRALTPQMFLLGALRDALRSAPENVTDEARAMELAGYRPLLVRGSPVNMKITTGDDLRIAEALITARHGWT